MNKSIIILISLFLFACKPEIKKEVVNVPIPYAIVIHGGAGNITPKNFSMIQQKRYRKVLDSALNIGYIVLDNGGAAIDAVQKTIAVLEDSPLFNAGKGAVFDSEGKNRLDASIMKGETLQAGAVAGITNIKNPIILAREVLDKSKHVLLSGVGAEKFAEQNNIIFKDDAYFYTKRQADYLKKVQKIERDMSLGNVSDTTTTNKSKFKKYGTVGCVALDKNGNIAAGTSTGGLTNKKFGRIGDSPLIGAGTYANNKSCGISCTGVGEYFIRTLAAHEVSNLIQYKHLSINEAIKEVIHKQIDTLGGEGGMIGIDNKGNIAWDFNTNGMFRAYKNSNGMYKLSFFDEKTE